MRLETWHIEGNGFHFGMHGMGQEESRTHLPSDSLFAAIVARIAERCTPGQVETFVAPFQEGTPPFVLSSVFPCAGKVRLFPAPLQLPSGSRADDAPNRKKLQKVAWVSEKVFRELLTGTPLASVYQDAGEEGRLHKGTVLVSADEYPQLPDQVHESGHIWKVERRPRVTIGRAAMNSQLYFTGRTVFNSQCGLWFAVRWLSGPDLLVHDWAGLLADLGDAGLGGERSAGFGASTISAAGPIDLPDADAHLWVSLSRYLPAGDEMAALAHERAAYSVERVAGWVGSPNSKNERRRVVTLLREGAVLGAVDKPVPGQIVDVRPSYPPANPDPLGHAVWRNGQALAVGYEGGPA